MNAKRTVAVTLLASLLAGVSLTAFAFGGDGKPQREEMRQHMRAYHEAVMSGALTDAELSQLKKERDAVHAQMQKLHQQLQAKTKALIANNDRSAKRETWPEAAAGKQYRGDRMRHHHGDGHCGAPATPPAAKSN
ncbi:hypothetical protein ACFSQE_01990 [Vogesella fluminis]|uniref:Zinc resistance-associated protein n=1 Tax=Vogesella fluminis TaxID=1069161 RepID=A0ABQ3H5I8_9NEIS|nr:hypothetical protein [Vogesella fluminis]GHD70585.1 hypothetical protein GCM10011419_01090 [Vogesella fluminis]